MNDDGDPRSLIIVALLKLIQSTSHEERGNKGLGMGIYLDGCHLRRITMVRRDCLLVYR